MYAYKSKTKYRYCFLEVLFGFQSPPVLNFIFELWHTVRNNISGLILPFFILLNLSGDDEFDDFPESPGKFHVLCSSYDIVQ